MGLRLLNHLNLFKGKNMASSSTSLSTPSSSVSSSTQLLSSSSSSMAENPQNLEKLTFIGNGGIVKGYMEAEGWERINYEESNNSNIVLESKIPFSWAYNSALNQLSQIRLDGTATNNTISNVPSCKSLFINPISGNTHILSNKEKTADGDYIYGGDLIYYSYFDKISANLSITYNQSIYDLFGAMDMVVDYVRNRIWICDTLNHKIISINSKTNDIDYVFSSANYIFPSSLAIDVSSETIFARAYTSTTLEEVIIIIKNNSVFSVFKSPGVIGLKDIYAIDSCAVVLDRNSSQSCVYRVELDSGYVEKTYLCQNQNINLLSGECLNNSIITYNSGIVKLILTNGNDLGETNVGLDNRFKFIPSIFDSSYWGYVYRSDGKHNMANIKVVGSDKILVSNGSATFNLPVGGSIIVGERKPIILINSGNTIIKLSIDGNIVEKTNNLINPYDIIDAHILNNVIIIGKKDQNYFKTLDYLFLQETDYNMASNIIDICAVQNISNYYWVLCEGNNLFKVRCLGGVLTIMGSINITSNTLVGVRHSFDNNGAIAFSSTGIFKISESGSSLVWKNEGFTQITDIFVNQDISTIYSAQFHYNSLTTKSMAFDSFRNKLWWLANGDKPKLCSLDLTNYSANIKDIDLPNIIVNLENI